MAAISFRASVLFLLLKCELVTVLIGNLETLFVTHRIYLMINSIDAKTFRYFLEESENLFFFSTVNPSLVSLNAGLMQVQWLQSRVENGKNMMQYNPLST